jgi:DNA-binding transcriptional regulator PaaX
MLPPVSEWAFLTNHANVLLCVAREPDTRLRHIAERIGISERATHRIVCDLIEAGYLTKHRLGRRSYYEVHADAPLRDPCQGDRQVADLFQALLPAERTEPQALTSSST